MKIRELLSDESKWIKWHEAQDKGGKVVDPLNPKAAKWCLQGAMAKCYFKKSHIGFSKIEDSLCREVGKRGYSLIVSFNDDPRITFLDVRDIVLRLDI